MKLTNLVKGAVVTLAALGMVMPQGQVHAASAFKSVKTVEASVADVALSNGTFVGRVVDHTGTPLASKEVVVRQGSKELAKVKTDSNGTFQVTSLKSGVYQVTSGATTGAFRVWTESAAPRTAGEQAVLVMGENGTRGQFGAAGGGTLIIAAAVITSVIISGITLNKINNTQDKLDETNSQIADLQDQIDDIQAEIDKIPKSE